MSEPFMTLDLTEDEARDLGELLWDWVEEGFHVDGTQFDLAHRLMVQLPEPRFEGRAPR